MESYMDISKVINFSNVFFDFYNYIDEILLRSSVTELIFKGGSVV